MESKESKQQELISGHFGAQLNSNGFGFHHRLIKEAGVLASLNKSIWRFVASEVPVSVQGSDTRIDFILRRAQGAQVYMLAECKRANPALSNWCFTKAPFVHTNRVAGYERIILEQLQAFDSARARDKFKSAATMWSTAPKACHIALDVKANAPGDTHDSGKGAIEKAATQIMRGLNGMVELFPQHPEMMKNRPVYFLPVIFTTANLWMSDVDLSTADLTTGKIDFSGSEFYPVDWVSYQYHLSPGIKHKYWAGNGPEELSALMDLDFIRTIPIVSPRGLENFLEWSSGLEING